MQGPAGPWGSLCPWLELKGRRRDGERCRVLGGPKCFSGGLVRRCCPAVAGTAEGRRQPRLGRFWAPVCSHSLAGGSGSGWAWRAENFQIPHLPAGCHALAEHALVAAGICWVGGTGHQHFPFLPCLGSPPPRDPSTTCPGSPFSLLCQRGWEGGHRAEWADQDSPLSSPQTEVAGCYQSLLITSDPLTRSLPRPSPVWAAGVSGPACWDGSLGL